MTQSKRTVYVFQAFRPNKEFLAQQRELLSYILLKCNDKLYNLLNRRVFGPFSKDIIGRSDLIKIEPLTHFCLGLLLNLVRHIPPNLMEYVNQYAKSSLRPAMGMASGTTSSGLMR